MITPETTGAPKSFALDRLDIILDFFSMDDHPPGFRPCSFGRLTGKPVSATLSEKKPDFLIHVPLQVLGRS